MLDNNRDDIINEINNEENIKNLVVFPLLVIVTLFDKAKILTTNFHPLAIVNSLISILLVILNIKDTIILENKKVIVGDFESSNINKRLNVINKKFDYIALVINIFIFLVHSVSFTSSTCSKIMLCKENPYQDKKIAYDDSVADNYIEDTILSSLEKNKFLNVDEKSEAIGLTDYFKENRYLDLENLYYSLLTLDTVYESNRISDDSTVASYNHFLNEVTIYNVELIKTRFSHEVVHLTGYLPYSFLNEGLTSLIKAEYCDRGMITDDYKMDIYLTEMILEIVSDDTLLEAYSKEDIDILINEMAKNSSRDNVKSLLDKINAMVLDARDNDYCLDFDYKMRTLEEIINYVRKEKFDYEKTKNILKYFFMISENPQTISKFHYNSEFCDREFEYAIRPEVEEIASTLAYLISDSKDYVKIKF